MKRNNAYVAKQFGGQYYLFPATDGFVMSQGMPVLNETGKWIWDALQEETSYDSILIRFSEFYGLQHDEADKDLSNFISALRSQGLILDDPA